MMEHAAAQHDIDGTGGQQCVFTVPLKKQTPISYTSIVRLAFRVFYRYSADVDTDHKGGA